jgi:hypothetical protein
VWGLEGEQDRTIEGFVKMNGTLHLSVLVFAWEID